MTKHHPGSKRSHDDPLTDDPFLEKTQSAALWAEENRGRLGTMALVLVLMIAGIWYFVDSRSQRMEQATIGLEDLRRELTFGDPLTAAVNLGRYVSRFDGTPQGDEARLLLGRLQLDQENPTAAIDALLSTGSNPGAGPLQVQAAFLLAKSYEAAGQLTDAEELYLDISGATELKYQIWDALAYAAAIRTGRGDLEPAAQLYRQILDSMDPNDLARGVYELRLGELEARMGS